MDPVDSNNCQSISGVHTVCTAASLLHRGAGFSSRLPRNRCAEYSTGPQERERGTGNGNDTTPPLPLKQLDILVAQWMEDVHDDTGSVLGCGAVRDVRRDRVHVA